MCVCVREREREREREEICMSMHASLNGKESRLPLTHEFLF